MNTGAIKLGAGNAIWGFSLQRRVPLPKAWTSSPSVMMFSKCGDLGISHAPDMGIGWGQNAAKSRTMMWGVKVLKL